MINIVNATRVYSTMRSFIIITNPDHSYIKFSSEMDMHSEFEDISLKTIGIKIIMCRFLITKQISISFAQRFELVFHSKSSDMCKGTSGFFFIFCFVLCLLLTHLGLLGRSLVQSIAKF